MSSPISGSLDREGLASQKVCIGMELLSSSFSSFFFLLYRGYFFSEQDVKFQHFLCVCAQLIWKIVELLSFSSLAAE
jgi:hypothetical protein